MGRVEEIAKEVDDGRQSGQQHKIAAAAESGRVGRPVRSTDMHNMHRALGPVDRPGRPKDPDCKQLNSRLNSVGRLGRPEGRSVDPPVDRQSGLGEILLLRNSGYLRLLFNSRVCDLESACEKVLAKALLHSKRLIAIVRIFLVI